MKRFVIIIFSGLIFVCRIFSQASDPVSSEGPFTGDTLQSEFTIDSNEVARYSAWANHQSFLLSGKSPVINDIQQARPSAKSATVFILLMVILGVLTYVKAGFSKDFEELIQVLLHQHAAQQIFRTQSRDVSFSSFLLHMNFIVALSLYMQLILVKYFHVTALESFASILGLIFLFTFFYLGKIITLKFIGVAFEVKEECDEYIFNFSTVCKTVGLTLIPALFIFHTAQENLFNIIFFISVLIFPGFAIIFVWRGLSTGYKLLYRSVYHFFVYVCVVEISPMFLLFKLLTKTIQ